MSKKHNIQDTQLVISPVAQAKPAVPFNYVTRTRRKVNGQCKNQELDKVRILQTKKNNSQRENGGLRLPAFDALGVFFNSMGAIMFAKHCGW